MALSKQNVPISFQAGIDTKTDRKQLQGKLLDLQNGVFTTGMELRKRNGYASLPSLSSGLGISAYNSELVSLDGSSLNSYDANGVSQINKGALPVTSLSVATVVRNTTEQTLQDSAINGTLRCFTWTDSVGGVQYSVFDSVTNQSIVNGATIAATATRSKVLAIGSLFVILYTDTGTTLKYKSINISTPTTLSGSTTIASDLNASSNFDATKLGTSIYLAYDNNATGITLYSLTSGLVLSGATTVGGNNASEAITVFADTGSNRIWVAFSTSAHEVKYFVRSSTLTSVLATTAIETATAAVKNITGFASSGSGFAYYEINATLSYNHFIRSVTISDVGVVGTPAVFLRSVGLASKVFLYNSVKYFLVAFDSTLQPTYFLVNDSGIIVTKIAESLGGGLTAAPLLPEAVSVSSGIYMFGYLIKDLLTSISGDVYTQTGVAAATVTFSTIAPPKNILGKNLHIGGGLLSMYDGGSVVEHGFNVYPEGVAATVSLAGDGFLKAPEINGNAIAQYQYSAVYEWTDNQGQLHRSAPSVPTSLTVNGTTPRSFDGHYNAFGSGSADKITNIPDTSTLSVGQYVNLLGAAFDPNLTIVSIDSANQITLSGQNGTVTSGDVTFVVSSQPMGWATDLVVTAGSDTIVLPVTANPTSDNLAIGQRLFFTTTPYANLTNPSPFPADLVIVDYLPMDPSGGGTPGFIKVNSQAIFSVDLTGGSAPLFYTFDTVKMTIVVPTLRLTRKAKVSIALYRTELNGSIFYRTTSPISLTYNDKTADTITISDTTSEGNLVGNEELYTTGGVVENIASPAVNILVTFKSRSITVPSENPLSWNYSKQVVPGLPVEFSDVFSENIDSRIGSITGVGVMDEKLIFFGPSSIFYTVGDGPTASGLNNSFTEAQFITSDTGCINQASIVIMPLGLMFQSPKGIYLLDRSLGLQYIGADVESYNSYRITSAQLMAGVNQVRFSMTNGQALVYDYYYKQWSVFTNHSVVDATIYNSNYTYISSAGVILTESPGVYTDNGTAVNISLTSNWLSFAQIQGFQRIYNFLFLGDWFSSHTLTANVWVDFKDDMDQTVAMPALTAPSTAYQMRVFINRQKCESMKIQLVESGSSGQGLSLSAVSFIAGLKTGLNKLPAAQSYG